MANVEGAIRMKRVGKFLCLGGLASTVLGAASFLLANYHPPFVVPAIPLIALGIVTYLGLPPLVVGALLWVSGWIVEGFFGSTGPE
jgi:hypothetical protein